MIRLKKNVSTRMISCKSADEMSGGVEWKLFIKLSTKLGLTLTTSNIYILRFNFSVGMFWMYNLHSWPFIIWYGSWRNRCKNWRIRTRQKRESSRLKYIWESIHHRSNILPIRGEQEMRWWVLNLNGWEAFLYSVESTFINSQESTFLYSV